MNFGFAEQINSDLENLDFKKAINNFKAPQLRTKYDD